MRPQPDTELQGAILGEDVSLVAKDSDSIGADEDIDDVHEDHSEEGKRKRKSVSVKWNILSIMRHMQRPCLQVNNSGKIELGGRRRDGSGKDGNKAPNAAVKSTERGGEGRGGDGKAPRAGGDARPKTRCFWQQQSQRLDEAGSPAPVKNLVRSVVSWLVLLVVPQIRRNAKGKREQVSAVEVDKAIRRTFVGAGRIPTCDAWQIAPKPQAKRADEMAHQAELRELDDAILRVTEFITVAELADNIGVPTNEIILKCMSLGLMVSINQRLEKDTITLVAADYGLEVEFEDTFAEEALEEDDEDDEEFPRTPVLRL